ncbi:MAG: beta-propeller domain-containing protein [Deltaproteobacteria bacterium]|nr:beta-propeller domain-containing protein [Deltaproteobacteria bacterium]
MTRWATMALGVLVIAGACSCGPVDAGDTCDAGVCPGDHPGNGQSPGGGWCSERPGWVPGSPTTWPEEACSAAPPGNGGSAPPLPVEATLRTASSCDDAMAEIRARLLREMNAALDQSLARALWLHCQPCYTYGPVLCDGGYTSSADASASPIPPTTGSEDSASEFSQTNTQVDGVDEADFVKNDGSYIYLVANGRFSIIDAWPPAAAKVIGSATLEGQPRYLYVVGDRAVVFSSLGAGYGPQQTCTYGYDCDFTGDGYPLRITVFDITDRAHPVVLRETSFGGSYLNSRRIGTIIHTVVLFGEGALPQAVPYTTWPTGLAQWVPTCGTWGPQRRTAAEIEEIFATLRAENVARIQAYKLAATPGLAQDVRYLPGGAVTEQPEVADCTRLLVSPTGDGQSLLSLVSFDAAAQDPLAVTTVLGRPGAVYASPDSLYVTNRHYGYGTGGSGDSTTVHKFRLTLGSPVTTYAGSGAAKGRVLNQFSMDEWNGDLRIATTTGWMTYNSVSILTEQAGALTLRGHVDLAPGEDIRAARFTGDTGFVVTFKKTDPLFVLDLADPAAPTVRGELHIPGFSTYIHLMDAAHLLTIGLDAQDEGSFAWFAGVMLQVFDVTNPNAPLLLHKTVIGTRGTASDATTNHLAFNYFRPLDLLAIPMIICQGGSGGGYGYQMTFNGLMVYRVTLADGFTLLGGIPHNAGPVADYYGCSSWWTYAQSSVKRSVIMDDWVYSIASGMLRASSLGDLGNPVVTLSP